MTFFTRFCLALLCTFSLSSIHAGTVTLIKETQQTRSTAEATKLVWWMPNEFFIQSSQERGSSKKTLDETLALIGDYAIFAVIDTKIGNFGTITAKTQSEVAASTHLLLNGKTRIEALNEAEIPEGVQTMTAILKPMFANMMGSLGKSFQFVIFKNRQDDGSLLIDASKTGSFTFMLSGDAFAWRLPLGSLLPVRFDPKTGEEFPGNYNFSPFSGDKLVLKPAAK